MLIECILLSTSLCHAVHDKPVLALGLMQSAGLLADGITTQQRVRQGYTETDPVTRLFLGSKPEWGAMAPLGRLNVFSKRGLPSACARQSTDGFAGFGGFRRASESEETSGAHV